MPIHPSMEQVTATAGSGLARYLLLQVVIVAGWMSTPYDLGKDKP